jgi:hypothetical protein
MASAAQLAPAPHKIGAGLSLHGFFLLPAEDAAEFEALFSALREEHRPTGPAEEFLVEELAQSQWKLRRAAAIEAGLLSPDSESWLARIFRADAAADQALLKLARYESGVRRHWRRALNELRALRRERAQERAMKARDLQSVSDNRLARMLDEAMAVPSSR